MSEDRFIATAEDVKPIGKPTKTENNTSYASRKALEAAKKAAEAAKE